MLLFSHYWPEVCGTAADADTPSRRLTSVSLATKCRWGEPPVQLCKEAPAGVIPASGSSPAAWETERTPWGVRGVLLSRPQERKKEKAAAAAAGGSGKVGDEPEKKKRKKEKKVRACAPSPVLHRPSKASPTLEVAPGLAPPAQRCAGRSPDRGVDG